MPQGLNRSTGGPPQRLGVYRIESRLGQGGMGEVYLAWDELLERHVAIKRIRSDQLADEAQRARFRREARAVARLSHPAIVQVFHILERDDGDCLVMEHVPGRELGKLIAGGEVDLRSALRLAREVAEGLGEAHAKGMVHRDLKPANVMVTPAGHGSPARAKILDFGLAKVFWRPDELRDAAVGGEEALTRSGLLVGTVHAMSPEQAGGRPVDHRSDLFALGSLIYEMLTGRAPFRGDNLLDTLRRVMTDEPPPVAEQVSGLPPELTRLVALLLAKDPERRPQNARAVAAELAAIESALGPGPEPIRAPDPSLAGGSAAPSAADPDQPTAARPSPIAPQRLPAAVEPSPVIRTLLCVRRLPGSDVEEPPGDGTRDDLAGRLDRRLRDLLARFNGLEVDRADGRLLLFERPAEAVGFALACHRSPARLRLPPVCLGIHLGEVVLRRQPPPEIARGAPAVAAEGPALAVAARVADLAAGSQTLLTRGAFDLARGAAAASELADGELRWLAHGAYVLPGLDEPVEVFEVGTAGRAPLAAPPESAGIRRAVAAGEELALGWRPAAGQVVPRRPNWELEDRLGEGGFGEVWLARHKSGEERVFKFCFEAERLRALKREVTLFRLLKETLGHRRDIARVVDWDFAEAPYFLEAEHTDGGNLAIWAERRGGLAAVPLATRLELVAEVAEALAAAHSVGILHKDVKPQNVLVAHDRDGRPRALLADFGIGLVTDRSRLGEPGFTVLGFTETALDGDGSSAAGTVRYMAPELLEGKPATIQADVYALGVLLYQMVVGDFARALAPGWRREIDDPLLAEDVAACVDGAPERRPANARELAERLRALAERRERRRAEEEARQARARSRRRRRLAGWLGIAAAVISLVVSVFAYQTLRAKERERQARESAEQRRRQAESLLDFLLGDLRQELEPLGKLDILDQVGDRAMEYFAAVPEGELSSEEVRNYAKALHQIGQVRFALGRVPEATAAFKESLALAEGLADRDPANAEWRFELGQSHFWLGFLHWRQRDLEAALERFEVYRRISQELVDRDPGNVDWQLELAYSHSNVASVLEERGELRQATAELEVSARVMERLSAGKGDDDPLRVELAHVYAKLGKVLESQGELTGALARYQAHLDLMRRASAAAPDNVELLRFLGLAHSHVGSLLRMRGEEAGAFEHFRADLEIAVRVAGHDPENLIWQEELALRHNKLARAYLAAGDLSRARPHLERDTALTQALVERDPKNRRWRLARARNRWSWALLWLGKGQAQVAAQELETCRVDLQALGDEPSGKRHSLWLARAGWLLGEAREALGDVDGARASHQPAVAVAEGLVAQDRAPQHLDILVRLWVSLDRPSEARPLIDKLAGIGYREAGYLAFLARRVPDRTTFNPRSSDQDAGSALLAGIEDDLRIPAGL